MAPVAALAQEPSGPPAVDWRSANEAVGEFRRGHVDMLKWERANLPADTVPATETPALSVATAQDAMRLAWQAHPALAKVQSRVGAGHLDLMAEGRWFEVDVSLQRRVDGIDELLEVAAEARKAWIEAVAAAQVVRFRQVSLDSAEAAHELARRMVSVGNWGAMEGRKVQLALVAARMDLRRAQVAAAQAQAALLQSLRLAGVHPSVGLAEELSDVPAQVMDAAALERRVSALAAQLPQAQAVRARTSALLAFEVYRASHALAQDSAQSVQLREGISEEIGLQYNGMLASVWDVLGDARDLAQARIEAVEARRDFWLAHTDLQWVLLGGGPPRLVSLGASGGDAAVAGGHGED